MEIDRLLVAPQLHHIGIVVRDLDQAVARYRSLGFGAPELFDVPEQGVRAATFAAGPGFVELIMPIAEGTGVARYLESRGEGMHHVAYAVPDIAESLARLGDAGFELIDTVPRTGVHGWRVAFVHPRSCAGVLTELVEVAEK